MAITGFQSIVARLAVGACLLAVSGFATAASIREFVGTYTGSAAVENDSGIEQRDMSVQISETDSGFKVEWESTIAKLDGRTKSAGYAIDFVESGRKNVFASAMQTNVFGHSVPLDPMKGEPYVWSRIVGDTLTVFSLYVDAEGGYEMQQYNRTLAQGGLELDYQRIRNGERLKTITTFLSRD